jgi:hypothetical protein
VTDCPHCGATVRPRRLRIRYESPEPCPRCGERLGENPGFPPDGDDLVCAACVDELEHARAQEGLGERSPNSHADDARDWRSS